jgi:DNA-binding MarR family transcriptional regulator
LDAQVGYLLRRASQRHAALFQEGIPHGLTPTQFAALVRLADVGPCSQNQLGRLASMDVATIKGVVERLRDKGLVHLRQDPDDRRRTLVSLSPEAEALVPALHSAGHAITEATLAPLSQEEAERLLFLLEKLT